MESSKDLLTLTTKDIMDEDSMKSILSAKQLGIMQHETFVVNRIVDSKIPITDTLIIFQKVQSHISMVLGLVS